MCEFCENNCNSFFGINESTCEYSGIDIDINRQGILRVRTFVGEDKLFDSQEIVNIRYCPMCGRKFQ